MASDGLTRAFVVLFFVIGIAPVAEAAVLRVARDGSGDFEAIQPALDHAVTGDTVLVARGTYVIKEALDLNRFHDPSNPQSPPLKNLTLRSELGPDETTISLSCPNPSLGCLDSLAVFMFRRGEDASTLVTGFTVRVAEEVRIVARVHGMSFLGSSPRIANCRIVECAGNGLEIMDSSPTIVSCELSRHLFNGVNCVDMSSPVFEGCQLLDNRNAGLRSFDSAPTLRGCLVARNMQGGILSLERSHVTLESCRILENSGLIGGGVRCDQSRVTLRLCHVERNIATRGGGLSCDLGSEALLERCTLNDNEGTVLAGGLSAFADSRIRLESSIIWHNLRGDVVLGGSSSVEASFSCIANDFVWPGQGNINVDPLFCGWGIVSEVFVDEDAPEGGDGTAARPFVSLEETFAEMEFTRNLSRESPCLGRGAGGSDMGSPTGRCAGSGEPVLTVRLAEGRYNTPPFSVLENAVSIAGAGASRTVLEGTVDGLKSGSSLADLTVTGGESGGVVIQPFESPEITRCVLSGNFEGGLVCLPYSSPLVRSCEIVENTATQGGGVLLSHASKAVLRDCFSARNRSDLPGAGVFCASTGSSAALIHCTVTENLNGGVALSAGSSLSILDSILWDNIGTDLRPTQFSTLEVARSCIGTNDLGIDGVWPGEGNLNVNPGFCGWRAGPSVFVDSSAGVEGDGGPGQPFRTLETLFESVDFDHALAADSPCVGTGFGGSNMGADRGVCDEGSLSSLRVHIAPGDYRAPAAVRLLHNVSLVGAGPEETIIHGTVAGLRSGQSLESLTVTGSENSGVRVSRNESPLIENCTIRHNSSSVGGGVFCEATSSPVLRNCLIVGNFAQVQGGGLFCEAGASASLIGCKLEGNIALSRGGAIYVGSASLNVSRCRLLGNFAPRGGAAFVVQSTARLTNTAVIANDADFGAALYSKWACVTIDFCTIADNRSESGTVFTDLESVAGLPGGSCRAPTVLNSVLWRNRGPVFGSSPDEQLPFVRFSLFRSNGEFPGEGNIAGPAEFALPGVFVFDFVSAEIGEITVRLPDFVFDSGDYHLVPDSPGVDAVDPATAPSTDLPGNLRPCGEGADVGAYETGGCSESVFRRGDADASGALDVHDAIHSARFQFAGAVVPLCLDAFDVDDNGMIDLNDPIVGLSFQFFGGPTIPAPGAENCGSDPTPDGLDCEWSVCSLR